MEAHLRKQYPSAHFVFRNEAIGGTGSKLGMFRVASGVLSHKPDLVFLDFTTEDKLDGTDRETLASYECILRDLISQGIPVVEVLSGSRNYFEAGWKPLGPTRLRDYLEMGNLYHIGIGNSFPMIQNFLQNGKAKRDLIWPKGQVHANDVGHRMFFEVARDGLERAILEKRLCNFPTAAVFADEYKKRVQFFPANLSLPAGWRVGKTLGHSLKPGEIPTDRMNEVAVSDAKDDEKVEPLQLSFTGTFLGILGEADENGLGFSVFIDGEPALFDIESEDEVWPTISAKAEDGQHFFWHVISDKLTPGPHTIKIRPVVTDGVDKGELRIGSICVAGPAADSSQSISATATGF